jgi:hypothetical protein
VFELVVEDVDHAAIFKLEEASAGCGEDEARQAVMSEDEELHVAPEGGGRPFVVFAFHCLPSARAFLPLLRSGKSYGVPFSLRENGDNLEATLYTHGRIALV